MIGETDRVQRLLALFAERFGIAASLVARAPGRVNLLGEHTDYNEGFVLPIAVDRSVLVAARPRSDRYVNVYSANFRRSISFSLDETGLSAGDKFGKYIEGVCRCLEAQGYPLCGMDAVIEGSVPIGSGLSSSAALEVATILSFEAASHLSVPPAEKARIGQRVENEFLGVQSGIMDQLASTLALKDHAILVDCRTLSWELVPLDSAVVKIVVCDSGVRRSLANSEYNRRHEECVEGVEILSSFKGHIRSLRDLLPRDLDSLEAELPEVVRRRCRHVVSENERVMQGVSALRCKDFARFGGLMSDSHRSLRDLYEVSCTELDTLVEAALGVEGVMGSRMTGAGFGGCTVSLVSVEALDDFNREVVEVYRGRTGREARIWICEPADGAGIILDLRKSGS